MAGVVMRFLLGLFGFTSVSASGKSPTRATDHRGLLDPLPMPAATSSPAATAVEMQAGVAAIPPAAAPAKGYGRDRDWFGGDVHDGSPDLAEWPPSLVELDLARRHLDDDDADTIGLWETCQSIARAQAVLAEVRRRREADALLGRFR